jgi:hypothetical protein
MGRRGRRYKQLLDGIKEGERVLEIEIGSTRSQCMENSVWKRPWTCRYDRHRLTGYKKLLRPLVDVETRWLFNSWHNKR